MAAPPQRPGGQPITASAFDPVQPETQSLGDAIRYNEELARETGGIEEAVEKLRARYDQWLIGLERREPTRERDELKRAVERLKTTFTRNTGLRFRIQSLHARFISYERMWQRSAREKEEGTYRRDLLRARRAAERAKKQGVAGGAAGEEGTPTPTPPPTPPPAQAAPRTPPPVAAPAPQVPGMSEAQLRALHAEYVKVRRACDEDTSRFTLDALARSLAKQVPELLSRFGARAVDFRVAVKDGKSVLKAVPRS